MSGTTPPIVGFDTLAAFEVLGLPAPQGSKTKMPNGAIVEGGSTSGRKKHKAWRSAVAEAARSVAGDEPHGGPLAVEMHYRFPMPASRPAAARRRGWAPHTVKPDVDKVVRATLDGLVDGGLIRGDQFVFMLTVTAIEANGWTGAEIIVRRWVGEGAADGDADDADRQVRSGDE